MNEMEELERRWHRYRFKKRLPWIITGGMIFLGIGGLSIYLFTSTAGSRHPISSNHAAERKIAPIKAVITTRPVQKNERKKEVSSVLSSSMETTRQKHGIVGKETMHKSTASIPLQEEKKEIVLNPDTAFLQKFAEEKNKRPAIGHKKSPLPPVKEKRVDGSEKIEHRLQKKVASPSAPIEVVTSANSVKKKPVLKLVSTQTNNTLKHIIDRFQQTRDPKLALYIAQSYFKKRAYEEAVRWSIMANSIEPSNEASWILYARAKVKLGHKNEAIKALKTYLNQYASRRVETYLEYLESLQ